VRILDSLISGVSPTALENMSSGILAQSEERSEDLGCGKPPITPPPLRTPNFRRTSALRPADSAGQKHSFSANICSDIFEPKRCLLRYLRRQPPRSMASTNSLPAEDPQKAVLEYGVFCSEDRVVGNRVNEIA
jgi:hypothetical protein